MRHQAAPAGPARPPGRGPKVRTAVLAATLSELAEKGYTALTIGNVAQRSGVHKTTIYRRWKDRESLVADAVTERATTRVPFPDTGDIDADLHELARSLVRFLNSPAGKAIAAVTLSDAARIPEIANTRGRFFQDRFRRAEPVVFAAIARGQLPTGTDPAELVRTLVAPIYLRLLVTAEPISETTADNAARVALAAARARALTSSPALCRNQSKSATSSNDVPSRSGPGEIADPVESLV
jgi:AcrR family transcriptional regulator